MAPTTSPLTSGTTIDRPHAAASTRGLTRIYGTGETRVHALVDVDDLRGHVARRRLGPLDLSQLRQRGHRLLEPVDRDPHGDRRAHQPALVVAVGLLVVDVATEVVEHAGQL